MYPQGTNSGGVAKALLIVVVVAVLAGVGLTGMVKDYFDGKAELQRTKAEIAAQEQEDERERQFQDQLAPFRLQLERDRIEHERNLLALDEQNQEEQSKQRLATKQKWADTSIFLARAVGLVLSAALLKFLFRMVEKVPAGQLAIRLDGRGDPWDDARFRRQEIDRARYLERRVRQAQLARQANASGNGNGNGHHPKEPMRR